ncbi:proton-coupled amino acid transporter-like protein pathetic isoform X2 [Ostrinia furnacalis]|uniref:proton-coupled amino acid transporter-like protein pathetic isoform X2 n=1 Tax=Ostrinia furnacalis TaxID=93504 RepID=UPI001038E071|nr:proton-coupled amino acid transporter-like protein pathetic isoform X2 [Ostrinia furnacalis]
MADTKGGATGGRGNFRVLNQTQAEEDAFDYVSLRDNPHPTGMVAAIAHMVKGALGGGILGGHVAYSKAGLYVALPLHLFFGLYITYCLYLLVESAQILYKRTKIPSMSYPDVGEAAMACHPNPKVARMAKWFRYSIDAIICLDLFGSCACYQLIIAKSLKQLVENTQTTSMDGMSAGYPSLRVYMAIMIVPIILICLIRHLKWLAPFSIAANLFIVIALGTAVFYAIKNNPGFTGMKPYTSFYNSLEYTGMAVFSMSCAGVVIPVENNMRDPKKFNVSLVIGMTIIVIGTATVSFFGYAAFLDKSEAPITVNFPMYLFLKILKGLIAVMIYVTHALNFWVPFNLCFYYIKPCHKQEKIVMWELFYRAIFVVVISVVAIIFPNINALMGFLGAFCLSNMAFIWPLFIHLLVIWHRPGLGKFRWRLWRCAVLLVIGFFLLCCGSIVNLYELVSVFK